MDGTAARRTDCRQHSEHPRHEGVVRTTRQQRQEGCGAPGPLSASSSVEGDLNSQDPRQGTVEGACGSGKATNEKRIQAGLVEEDPLGSFRGVDAEGLRFLTSSLTPPLWQALNLRNEAEGARCQENGQEGDEREAHLRWRVGVWHSASRVHATVPAPDAHAGASTGCTHMGGSASCCHPFPFPCATVLVLCCTVVTAVVVSRAVMSHRRFASWGCSFGVPLYSAPCCVFEVVRDSGRVARSESRTRPVLRVRNLALSVTRPASFRVSVYLYGVTRPTSCFIRSALLVSLVFQA